MVNVTVSCNGVVLPTSSTATIYVVVTDGFTITPDPPEVLDTLVVVNQLKEGFT
ncbi:hypothetical protein D3C86_1490670 [compost metagenome]